MWGRKKDQDKAAETPETPQPLKDAVREARIEAAERSGVVVDLRDADRDTRTDDCCDQHQQQEVAVDDAARKSVCGVEATGGAGCHY